MLKYVKTATYRKQKNVKSKKASNTLPDTLNLDDVSSSEGKIIADSKCQIDTYFGLAFNKEIINNTGISLLPNSMDDHGSANVK